MRVTSHFLSSEEKLGGRDSRACPDIELHNAGVSFEPICELVCRREKRPVRREGKICHVRVLNWIVGHKCAVAVAPIAADACVLVDEKAGYVECLEAGCDVESSLAGSYDQYGWV